MAGECDCCGFERPVGGVQEYPCQELEAKLRGETKRLCALCAGTLAGVAYDWQATTTYDLPTLRTICYVGNQLRRDLASK